MSTIFNEASLLFQSKLLAKMKPTPISNYTILASMLLLFINISLVAPQPCNLRCSDKIEHPATNLYALKTSEVHYPTWKTTSLNVKVYRTKCPELNTPGPTWYKIEAFMKDEKKTVGNFKDFAYPILEEISLTHDKTAVEFSSWHSFAISDLPRTYRWNKDAGNNGIVCFRLTVLVDMCRQTVLCIRPRSANMNIPTEAPTSDSRSGSGSGEFLSSGLDNLEDEDKTPVIPADCANNCTNARQGNFCSLPDDGNKYSSRCEWRVQKCALRARGIDVEAMEVIKCDDPELQSSLGDDNKPCWSDNDSEMWTRGCKCDGFYKLIQCGNRNSTKCWCSNRHGTQLTNKEDFKCKDKGPETYDPFSKCAGLYR